MRSLLLTLLCTLAASGCAGTHWSVVDSRPLMAVTVAPAELHGPLDRTLVTARRYQMIDELRAHGYQVLEAAAPGVPTLTMKIEGALITDSALHAPDDPRHNIYNDLHYAFVDYKVHIDLVDAGGRIVVCGSASSDHDPEGALTTLTAHLVRDVPSAASTLATR